MSTMPNYLIMLDQRAAVMVAGREFESVVDFYGGVHILLVSVF